VKGTYPIGAMLRKLFRIGFGDTFQEPEISADARRRSQEHYREQSPAAPLKITPAEPDPDSDRDRYLKYQRELQAGNLMPGKVRPRRPGSIIKLPLTESLPSRRKTDVSDDGR
jgi:hypothetical protein